MRHAVLLGDSILDNGSYVASESAVSDHLRNILPSKWRVTLLAQDGATATATFEQIDRIPDDATHLILSAGGNDALWMSGNLYHETTETVRESLTKLGEARIEFQTIYTKLIQKLRTLQTHLTVCTIYDSVPGLELSETTGVSVFNDTISRVAAERNLPLIDLRVICDEITDYSERSPIEPSSSGGLKIARAISKVVQSYDQLIVG